MVNKTLAERFGPRGETPITRFPEILAEQAVAAGFERTPEGTFRRVEIEGAAAGFEARRPTTTTTFFRAVTDRAAREAATREAVAREAAVSSFRGQVSFIGDERGSLERQTSSLEAEGRKLAAQQAEIDKLQGNLITRGTVSTNRKLGAFNKAAASFNVKAERLGVSVDAFNQKVSQSNIQAGQLNLQLTSKEQAALSMVASPFVKEFVVPGEPAPGLPAFGLETSQARATILRQQAELRAFRERPPPPIFALEPIEDFPLFVEERVEDIKAAGKEFSKIVASFKQRLKLSKAAREAGEKAVLAGDFGTAFAIASGDIVIGTGEELEKRARAGLLGLEIGTGAAGLGFVALGEPVIGALPEKEVKFIDPFGVERKLTKGGFRAGLDIAGQLAFVDAAFRLPAAARGTKALVTGEAIPKALRLDQPLVGLFEKGFVKDLPTEEIFTSGKFLITEKGQKTQVAFLGQLEKKFLGKGIKVKFARQLGFEEPPRPIIGFLDETLGKKFVGDIADPFALQTKEFFKEFAQQPIPGTTKLRFIKQSDDFPFLFEVGRQKKITGIKTLDPSLKRFNEGLEPLSIKTPQKSIFRTPTAALGLPPEQAAKIKPFLLRQPITGKAFVAFEDDLTKGITSEFFQVGAAKPTRIRAGTVETFDLEKFLTKGVRETKKEFSERVGSDVFGFTTDLEKPTFKRTVFKDIKDILGIKTVSDLPEPKLFKGEVFGDIRGILEPEPGIKAKAVGTLFGEFKLQDDASKFIIKPASVEFISFEEGAEAIGKTLRARKGKAITPFGTTFGEKASKFRTAKQNKAIRAAEKAAKEAAKEAAKPIQPPFGARFAKTFAQTQKEIQKNVFEFFRISQKATGGLISASTRKIRPMPVSLANIVIPGSAQALALGLPARPKGKVADEVEFLTARFKAGEVPGFEKETSAQFLGQGFQELQQLTFGVKQKPISLRKQKQELETRLKTELGLKTTPISGVIPIQKFRTAELLTQRQRPALIQRIAPIQRLALGQRVRTITGTSLIGQRVTVQATKAAPIEPLRPSFPIFGFPIPKTKITKAQVSKIEKPAFATFVKKKGKFKKVSKRPLHQNTALELGSFITDNIPARTFKIEPTEGKPTGKIRPRPALRKFRKPIKGGKVQRKSPLWVERTIFAIDRPGEVAGITALGIAALRDEFFRKKKPKKVKPEIFRKIKERKQAFETLVKSEGMFVKSNRKPLHRENAIALGHLLVDNTISREFRVRPTRGKPTGSRLKTQSPLAFKFEENKGGLFSERRKFWFDTKGERAGLQLKGFKAPGSIFTKKRKTKRKRGKR